MKYLINWVLILLLFILATGQVEAMSILPVPTPDPAPKLETKDLRSWTKSKYNLIIDQTAKKYEVDPQIIYATIMTESNGNELAYRYEPHLNDASLGLGQILTSTARMLGFYGNPRELYKPEVGIDLIGRYHRNMLDKYGQLSPAQLATAYNAGAPFRNPVYGHINRFNSWYFEEV